MNNTALLNESYLLLYYVCFENILKQVIYNLIASYKTLVFDSFFNRVATSFMNFVNSLVYFLKIVRQLHMRIISYLLR